MTVSPSPTPIPPKKAACTFKERKKVHCQNKQQYTPKKKKDKEH